MAYAGFNRRRLRARHWHSCVAALASACWVGCGGTPLHAAPEAPATADTAPTTPSSPPRFVSPYTYEHFIRAELAAAKGDLRAAAEGYRRALAGADEDALVIARLALTLDALGKDEQARELLGRGDALDPTSEAIWLARGEIAERHGDVNDAIAAYERAETFAPLSPDAPLALARMLHDAPERAAAVLRRFAARNDRWNPSRLHTELAQAIRAADLNQALAAFHTLRTVTAATVEETTAVARLALEARRPWVARALVPNSMMRTRDPELWLRVLIENGDVAAAELMINGSTPDELGGVAAMAQRYLEIGALDRAGELAATSVASDPRSAALLTWLHAAGLGALADELQAHGSLTAQ